jgi:hypothetical protein
VKSKNWLLGAATGAILIGSLIGVGCKSSSTSNANATKTAQSKLTPAKSATAKAATAGATPTASGAASKAAFCRDNAAIDQAATGGFGSPGALLTYFKTNPGVIDDFGRNAPSDIQADAQFLVNAVHAAIDTNNATSVSSADVAAAGARVDSYCGQNANGTQITPIATP